MMSRKELERDRALGALAGVAIGDALGMPSQTFDRGRIRAAYGRISDFVDPVANHPVSAGLSAGTVTDDTEQTLLLAERLSRSFGNASGEMAFDCGQWARDLLDWEESVRKRGLLDLLGPSSRRAIDAILAGTPASEAGRCGTTNGAAMRVAPIGIATPPEDPSALARRVAESCRVTHNTREAISAATAVAMTVSLGVDGAEFSEAAEIAADAAEFGADLGAPVGESDVAGLVREAIRLGGRGSESELAAAIGTSVASRESIPAAFGVVALANGDPWQAGLVAANIGDDTDTIGAIACAMAGACAGYAAFPPSKAGFVIDANRLDIEGAADRLLAIRALGIAAEGA